VPTAPAAIGDLLIIAALADPAGSDTAAETVTLLNTSASALDLTGWSLADAAGGRQSLTGNIGPGDTLRVPLTNAVQLSNQGDTILLADTSNQVISQVTYTRNQIRPGRSIKF
jgi:hypothetical protein